MEVHGVKSWFDRHHGVVTVDDDVQNVVRDVRAISDRLHIFYNPQTEGFDVVESCLDGTDRLVFSVQKLDQRVVHRLRSADHWRGREDPDHMLGDDEDFTVEVDAYNEQVERERDETMKDRIRDAGERIAWALDIAKDHHSPGGQILVPRGLDELTHQGPGRGVASRQSREATQGAGGS